VKEERWLEKKKQLVQDRADKLELEGKTRADKLELEEKTRADKLELEEKAGTEREERRLEKEQRLAKDKTERIDRERYEDKRQEWEEQIETRRYNKTMDMAEEKTQLEHADRAKVETRLNSRSEKLKKAADLMRVILFSMPKVPSQIPDYFEQCDKLFESNFIDETMRSTIIHKYLTDEAKTLLVTADWEPADDYKLMKALILET